MLNNRVHTHDRVIYNEAELAYKNCSNNEKQTSESETSNSTFFFVTLFYNITLNKAINDSYLCIFINIPLFLKP